MFNDYSLATLKNDFQAKYDDKPITLKQGAPILVHYFMEDLFAYNVYTVIGSKVANIFPVKEELLNPFDEKDFDTLEQNSDIQHNFVSLKIIRDYLKGNSSKK
jgi:hypothetical protein